MKINFNLNQSFELLWVLVDINIFNWIKEQTVIHKQEKIIMIIKNRTKCKQHKKKWIKRSRQKKTVLFKRDILINLIKIKRK